MAALAFIKNFSDRNDNMQYLECLSAAIQDMAHTYQPAELMSVVLQAVMAELRGNSVQSSTSSPRPKGVIVPARRGSSNDEERPFFKRRQTARARSFSSAKANMSTGLDIVTAILPPPSLKYGGDADPDRVDGFVLVTPRSEICSWQNISSDTALDPGPSTPITGPSLTRSAWIGAGVPSRNNVDISHLAGVHFPEIDHPTNNDGGNRHLRFTPLRNDEWRDWHDGSGNAIATDLDGFPPAGGFGGPFPTTLGYAI